MAAKTKLAMVGCCLVDRLYNRISFSDSTIAPFLSEAKGDGGLSPGHLVFKEEFETFCKSDFPSVLKSITHEKPADKINIGGPGIVPIIHASQLFDPEECDCRFYGCVGNDSDGEFIRSTLSSQEVDTANLLSFDSETPSTIVLSDPNYDDGHGERMFINSIAAAWNYDASNLDDEFYASDVVVFGGTGLVPQIHDELTYLLKKANQRGCFTIVNTVFDFRNEKRDPLKKWPLGNSDESYKYIDLLVVDHAEALRMSGTHSLNDAITFFKQKGTAAVVITNGARNIILYAEPESRFAKVEVTEMPVSSAVSEKIKSGMPGDTTGCGDNFVGGMLASVVWQMNKKQKPLNLEEACRWGIVSGGFSCFYMGGTFLEKYPGEKRELITPLYLEYGNQLNYET